MAIDIVYGKKVKLDKKDKKILEALYEDGRMPISKIAKKTGLQRDSINYRIKKMLKENVISFIIPILNPPKMGFPTINYVNFELQNLDEEIEGKFIVFLKQHKNVIYIASLSGRWDYLITIAARDPGHFHEILKEIRLKFSSIIKEYETSTIIKEPKYDRMIGLVG